MKKYLLGILSIILGMGYITYAANTEVTWNVFDGSKSNTFFQNCNLSKSFLTRSTEVFKTRKFTDQRSGGAEGVVITGSVGVKFSGNFGGGLPTFTGLGRGSVMPKGVWTNLVWGDITLPVGSTQTRNTNNLQLEFNVETMPLSSYNRNATQGSRHKECYNYEITRCGDGIVDNPAIGNRSYTNFTAEECDYMATGEVLGETCTKECKRITKDPECKTEISQTIKDVIQNGVNLNAWYSAYGNRGGASEFCKVGGVHTNGALQWFSYDTTNNKITWRCQNGEKLSSVCEYSYSLCGDGKKNGNEECDGNDGINPNTEFCTSECRIVKKSTECVPSYRTLRAGKQWGFELYATPKEGGYFDRFGDIYIHEDNNYNKQQENELEVTKYFPEFVAHPNFNFEDKNSVYVKAGEKKLVGITTKPGYAITNVYPNQRKRNNLVITGSVIFGYDWDDYNENEGKYNKEFETKFCDYYEITRCGDGKPDKDDGEECDLGSENGKEGSTCSIDCKTVTPKPQPRCGDGVKNGDEDCDYNADGEKLNETCTLDCKRINTNPSCGSEHNTTVYNTNFPNPRLDILDNLCINGNVTDFNFDYITGAYSWKCNGKSGTTPATCRAKDLRCGDGIKQAEYGEECDGKAGVSEGQQCTNECKLQSSEYALHKSFKSATWDGSKWNVVWTINGSSKNQTTNTITLHDTLPDGYEYVSDTNKNHYNKGDFIVDANGNFSFEVTTKTNKIHSTAGTNKICVKDKDICDSAKTPAVEIKKTAKKNMISSTSEKPTWDITVKTLNDKSISNFQITDTIPEGLKFEKIESNNSNITISKTNEEGKNLTFDVKGTLNGNSSVTFTITTSIENTKSSYKNIACLKGSEPCSEDTITTKFVPKLSIKKYFVSDENGTNPQETHAKITKAGETIYYKIEFKNEGEKDATVKVEDFFPANLTNTGIDTFVLDGETKNKSELSSFTLKAKGNGYIITHGTTTSENRSSTTNTGRITKLDDNGNTPSNCQKNDCYFEDTVTYTVDMHPKLWIEKGIRTSDGRFTGLQSQLSFKGGDTITFEVHFGNSGEAEATNIRFEDIISNLTFLEQVGYTEELTINDSKVDKNGKFNIKVGDQGKYILTGKIRKEKSQESTSNQACLVSENNDKVCSSVFFQPKFPALKIHKDFEGPRKGNQVYAEETGTFIITLHNVGELPITGITVTDILPDGMEYVDVLRTNGYWNGDPNTKKEENSDDKVSFDGTKTIKKSTNFSGTINNVDTLKFNLGSTVDIYNLTLSAQGTYEYDNIEEVTLSSNGKTRKGKKENVNNRTFNFVDESNNNCPATVNTSDSLALNIKLKNGGNEGEELYFKSSYIKGTRNIPTGTTSNKISFIQEKAILSGGEAEASISADEVIIDQLSFSLVESFNNGVLHFTKVGGDNTLNVDNIHQIRIGDSEIPKNDWTDLQWRIPNGTNDGASFPIKVVLTGIIPDGATLQFEVKTLTGSREIKAPDTTTKITFKKGENDVEKMAFQGDVEYKNWDIEVENEIIDKIDTKFLWDITFPKLSLKQNGDLDTNNIRKITIDDKEGKWEGNTYVFENISFSKGQTSHDVRVYLTGEIASGKTLQLEIDNDPVENREIIKDNNRSDHITFTHIPEIVQFDTTGAEEIKTNTNAYNYNLQFTLNKPLTVKDVAFTTTGSREVKEIKIDQTHGSCKDSSCKITFRTAKTLNNGGNLKIELTFSGQAQSGDTFGLILQDLNEKRHIATGAESKLLIFVENPESAEFVDSEKSSVINYITSSVDLDNLKFHLNQDLTFSEIALKNIGTLSASGISKVTINGEDATKDGNIFTLTKSITVKDGDSLPVKVFFNTPLETGKIVQLELTAMKDGRNIGMGTKSKQFTIIDNPAIAPSIKIGGTLTDDKFTDHEMLQETFKVTFNNLAEDAKVTLKKIILQKTGSMTISADDEFTLVQGDTKPTRKLQNNIVTFDFDSNGLTLKNGSTFDLNDKIKDRKGGDALAFQIIGYEIAEENILTGVEKEGYTRTLTVADNLITLGTEQAGDQTVKTASEITLDYIIPTFIGTEQAKITNIVLKRNGSIPLEKIESVKFGNKGEPFSQNNHDNTYFFNNGITIKSGDKLELKVKLNTSEITNNSDLRFSLESFTINSETSTGFVKGKETTNKLIFNNPFVELNGEGSGNKGSLDGKDFNLGNLTVKLDGIDEVKIKDITLSNKGGIKKDQIENLQLGNYNADNGTFKFNFGEGLSVKNGTTFTVKGTLTGTIAPEQTLWFEIESFTVAEDIEKDHKKSNPNTTKSLTYATPSITLSGSNGTITSKNKDIKLDTLTLSNNVKVKSITLQRSGTIEPYSVSLVKECTTDTKKTIYTCPIDQNVQQIALNVVLTGNTTNQSELQFIITNYEVEGYSKDTTKIGEKLTNKLTFNDPFVTLKGEESKEVQIFGNSFTGGQITVSYDGVDEIKLDSITLTPNGIDGEKIASIKLVNGTNSITGQTTKTTVNFKMPENLKLSQQTSPMTFTIEGTLKDGINDDTKFSFKVSDLSASDNQNKNIENKKISENPDSTRTWVFKKAMVKLGVHNKEDFTTGTRKNLVVDIFTGELNNISKTNIKDLILKPYGTATEGIEKINVGGINFSKQSDGSYKAENDILLNENAKHNLTINLKEEPANNSTLWFEVTSFSTKEGYQTGFTNGNKTPTVTFNNPKITLKGDGKGEPQKYTVKSDFNLGNLTFNKDGIESIKLQKITLKLSGDKITTDNITNMQLTDKNNKNVMNGTVNKDGNVTFSMADKTNYEIKEDGFQLKVIGTLTGNITDNAELYFEVKDFTVEGLGTLPGENTTKSIKFINPTIFLEGDKGNNSDITDSFTNNGAITIRLQETKEPIIKTITLEAKGELVNNIENIKLGGFTGERTSGKETYFTFNLENKKVSDNEKLALSVTFTGDNLKGKKVNFSITNAEGDPQIKIEDKGVQELTHGVANSCEKLDTTNGYFEHFDPSNRILTWDQFTGALQPGKQIELKFIAKITTGGNNIASFTAPDDLTGQDEANVVLLRRPNCTNPNFNPTSLNLTYNQTGTIQVTCATDNGEKAESITIDCGNETTYTGKNTNSFTKDCTYDKNKLNFENNTASKPVSCKVEVAEDPNKQCTSNITFTNERSIGYCGDGEATDGGATDWEDCDCTTYEIINNEKVCSGDKILINKNRISKDENSVKRKYSCNNCKLEPIEKCKNKECESISTPIACWDVNNGSISINEGEILPFYWNIEKVNSEKYLVKDGKNDTLTVYTNLSGDTCNQSGILLNSMLCTFKIYGGKDTEGDNTKNYLYKFTLPCFMSGENKFNKSNAKLLLSGSDLLSNWANWNNNNFIKDGNANGGNSFRSSDEDNVEYKFKPNISYITGFGLEKFGKYNFPDSENVWNVKDKSKNESDGYQRVGNMVGTYGEYKLQLAEVDYLECIYSGTDEGNQKGTWTQMAPYKRICENNFTLTKPYLVTKTPSGIGSNVKDLLSNFYFIGGDSFAKSLNNLVELNDNNGGSDVESSKFNTKYEEFKEKYQKLAKPSGKILGVDTSKVPGKEIYFASGDMIISGYTTTADSSKTVFIKQAHKEITTPITIIQTSGNTTIKGHLNHNIMLLSEGKIIFDGTSNCDDTQTVNGIFYAKSGFDRTGVQRNNDLKHDKRCIGGGLRINGALIGSGIQNLVDNSRSNLNTRFYGAQKDASTNRKNLIYSGAAVLIEYSSSLTEKGSTPPGAEDFTQSLNIYKK